MSVPEHVNGNEPSHRQGKPAITACLYARASTQDQNCELQLRELRNYAEQHGLEIVEIYQDVTSSGTSHRPGFMRLMADAEARRFNVVLVWKLDRFGRSLVDCLSQIQTLEALGIRFIAITQGLDTDYRNPASHFMLQVLGAAAEYEQALIAERSPAGLARYREDYRTGKVGTIVHSRSGRDLPPHRPKKIFDRDRVLELHGQGLSMRRIARLMGLGLGTVSRTIHACSKSTGVQEDGASIS
jgi:DNA invertase Pin-like site-specific DNA recombinase